MDSEYVFLAREPSRAVPGPAIAGSLMMQVGFIGVSLVAIAVVLLERGAAGFASALLLAAAGLIIAVFAWRRSWSLLEQAEESAVNPPTAPAEAVEAFATSPTMARVNRALKYVAMPA